jgi:DNA gyrase subunit B
VLNERRMREVLTGLGLESTELVIRDDSGIETRRLRGPELRKLIDGLNKLEELVTVVQRRGIDFGAFLEERERFDGHLPSYRVVVDGKEHYFKSAEQRSQFLSDNGLLEVAAPSTEPLPSDASKTMSNGKASTNGKPTDNMRRIQKNHELHEVKELERLFNQLVEFGLSIDDYYLTQEESVSGEKLPTKYALVNEEHVYEVAGVAQILPEVLKIAKGPMEVKRFKGLGEMNAEQLWETTLDPTVRTLMRVNLHEAAEAERLFSILMGEDVERRRQFIEEHALEVKNLDV